MRLELEEEVRMDIRQGPGHAWSCGLFEESDIILRQQATTEDFLSRGVAGPDLNFSVSLELLIYHL